MTEAEWKALECYVRDTAGEMALKDWKIQVERMPCADDSKAQEASADGRKSASIWIAWNFRDMPPQTQRAVIVHELLHCHCDPSWKYLKKTITPGEYEAFKHQAEYAIDGIADAFAEVFPLIDWPKPEKPQATTKTASTKRKR